MVVGEKFYVGLVGLCQNFLSKPRQVGRLCFCGLARPMNTGPKAEGIQVKVYGLDTSGWERGCSAQVPRRGMQGRCTKVAYRPRCHCWAWSSHAREWLALGIKA